MSLLNFSVSGGYLVTCVSFIVCGACECGCRYVRLRQICSNEAGSFVLLYFEWDPLDVFPSDIFNVLKNLLVTDRGRVRQVFLLFNSSSQRGDF